jgi:hypothetical protein
MWANPAAHVGESYRQEFYERRAEDWGKVIAVGQTVTVPLGTFTLHSGPELDGLESAGEYKYYCPQIRVVLERPVNQPTPRTGLLDDQAVNRFEGMGRRQVPSTLRRISPCVGQIETTSLLHFASSESAAPVIELHDTQHEIAD